MDAKVQFVILAQWPGDRKVLRSKGIQFSPSSLLLVACPFQSLNNWPSLETAWVFSLTCQSGHIRPTFTLYHGS